MIGLVNPICDERYVFNLAQSVATCLVVDYLLAPLYIPVVVGIGISGCLGLAMFSAW